MKSRHERVYDTFGHYINAIRQSCPDPFPDSFADYQGGVWLAEGKFFIRNKTTMPKRKKQPDFWSGYDSVKK